MIRIREYESSDYTGLMLILGSVYSSNIERQILEEKYITQDKRIFIAEETDNKRIIGDVFIERQIDYVRPSQVLYITYLAVDEKYRGKGIGKQIMDFVEDLCEKMNCSAVEFTSADFRTDAHAFYNAIGYSKKKTTHFIKEI